jgi:hypothetical protein
MIDEKISLQKFRGAMRVLDAQRKMLIDAGAEHGTIDALSAIIRHLNGLSELSVLKIVDGKRHRDSLRSRKDQDAAIAANATLDTIEELLSNERTTRLQLEAIAIGRFQVPRGSLRSLGNIDQLRDKISTLVRNERAHETISSVAKESRF